MNNQEKYRKAIDEIHASDELKQKTIQKIRNSKNQKKVIYIKYLSACAVFVLAAALGNSYCNKLVRVQIGPGAETPEYIIEENKPKQMSALNKELPRFESFEELEKVLKDNMNYGATNSIKSAIAPDSIADLASVEENLSDKQNKSDTTRGTSDNDYSKTNVQVENVDEADIVKTDGEYIYYVTRNTAYIIKADNLEIVSELNYMSDKEMFRPQELYVNGNKLILIGNYNTFQDETNNAYNGAKDIYVSRIYREYSAEALVLDIHDKANPKISRTVRLDGNYNNSRMIGNNVYLIASKSPYYFDGMKEKEILPCIYDSVSGEETIAATDIAYFPDTGSYAFMTVAGFDINNDSAVCSETFFGASETIYASEKNLYISQVKYDEGNWRNYSNIIYKFRLDGSKIELLCKGEVKGNVNNQFSMDEYEGNLRIATTSSAGGDTTNQLYVLDENLNEIGKIEYLAPGERIYAVRFMGKIGYVVTFEQVDPLFVIDLSNPRNPEVKGELKIPGYSSYLHPYDETHIIGIGYNTKPNGYGGVTNANMKMSMFDVSNLEEPKEMFSVDIGEDYAYSQILYNHKVLFEKKQENLIGFPVTFREYNARYDKDAFVVFKIDLENGFEKYGEISKEIDYRTNIDRAIYIGDTLYTLAELEIKSYNLRTFEELNKLTIDQADEEVYYIKEDLLVN